MNNTVLKFETFIFIIALLLSSCKKNDNSKHYEILFLGDTSFGENYQIRKKSNILKTKGYDYVFKNFKDILTKSELVIANLETPITNLRKSPLSKKYIHYTDIKKAPYFLKKYNINTISLANNHAMDYGVDGLKQTLDILEKNSINWMGAGLNAFDAEIPYIKNIKIGNKSFKFAIFAAFELNQKYETKYFFYANKNRGGVNLLSIKKLKKQIDKLRKSYPGIFVIAFPHWGKNYRWKSKKQTNLAHQIIDAGADLIIGHGAHMMQEIENYKNNWIIYSLGNFIFNSPGRYKKYRVQPFGLITQLLLKEEKNILIKKLKIYPIFTDNRITKYQGRFLKEKEFNKAYHLLQSKSSLDRSVVNKNKNRYGYYLEINLK